MRLLIVEDEAELARLVRANLAATGFLTDAASSLSEALALVAMTDYPLVILDRRLPDGDGMSAVGNIRALRPGVRIIMLTALDAVDDRVSGLEAGADDYLTKPFAQPELVARVRAHLRRPGADADRIMSCGRLAFNVGRREATVNGVAVVLQRRELALLEMLIGRSGRVVRRETIQDTLYGLEDEVLSNALDTQVSRLRRRLSDLGADAVITTVRGVGYMMSPA